MNLFLRLFMVFLRARFARKRIGLLDESKLNFRVWLTDQDMFMHMTNSRYMSFSDLGTVNYIIRCGAWKALQKRGWYPVICAQKMTISRMLKTPQKFTLVTRITGWNDTYVALSHAFMHKGQQHAEVRVIARFASRDKKRVAPQDMVDAVGSNAIRPELSTDALVLIEELESRRAQLRSRSNNK